MRPIIGILGSVEEENGKTPRYFLNKNYWDAVLRSGGIPLLLPYAEDGDFAREVLSSVGVSGLLFAGGDDIRPAEYGEETLPECGSVSVRRDRSEKSYVEAWNVTRLPCLGICRGVQTLNVFLGGTLWQDIPSQIPGAVPHGKGATHLLIPEGTGILSGFSGEELCVNSFHHQAIKDLSPALRIEAVTSDGVVEAVSFLEHPNSFAVQFHPEKIFEDSRLARALFARLIEEAKR